MRLHFVEKSRDCSGVEHVLNSAETVWYDVKTIFVAPHFMAFDNRVFPWCRHHCKVPGITCLDSLLALPIISTDVAILTLPAVLPRCRALETSVSSDSYGSVGASTSHVRAGGTTTKVQWVGPSTSTLPPDMIETESAATRRIMVSVFPRPGFKACCS